MCLSRMPQADGRPVLRGTQKAGRQPVQQAHLIFPPPMFTRLMAKHAIGCVWRFRIPVPLWMFALDSSFSSSYRSLILRFHGQLGIVIKNRYSICFLKFRLEFFIFCKCRKRNGEIWAIWFGRA